MTNNEERASECIERLENQYGVKLDLTVAAAVQQVVTEELGRAVAATTNYVADKEVHPQKIMFANGRVVKLVSPGNSDRVFLDVGSVEAGD